MSQDLRRILPAAIAMVFGIGLFINYFLDLPILNSLSAEVQNWIGTLAAAAMAVGGLSVIIRYTKSIGKKEGTWYPLVVLGSMIVMFVTGIPGFEEYNKWMIGTFRDPLELASYGMVLMFVTSAAFRAFRIRSLDTLFMVIAAFLAFLADTPMAAAINKTLLYAPGRWINDVIILAVQRAVNISAYMGIFLLWLRTTLGFEKRGLGIEG